MKKFLLYACVALLSCIAFAQTNVVVVLKEGVKKIYEAAAVDSIRINKNEGYDAVVVLKNGKEEKYAAKDIDNIKIEKEAPVPAEETGLLFSYYEESNTASVRGIKNYDDASEIKIPSQVVYNGVIYDVTLIKLNAFAYASYSSIEIPNSVTSIAEQSFYFCVNLTSIEIPSSVTKIGRSAFADCKKLKTARVPVGCELGNNAFPSTCKIEWYDPLTGEKIISAEESFLTFEYDETTMTASVTGVENKELTFIKIGIPSKVLNDGKVYVVTSIGEYAFEKYESLESIEIPNSVTSIEASAFLGCKKLARIEIPSSVTSIGSTAFARCSSLKKARVPLSCVIEKIDVVSSFPSTCAIEWYDPLTSFTFWFDETAKTAIVTGFENYEATFVEIPSVVLQNGKEYDVTEIDAAFGGCRSLISIEIPNSVTSIGYKAFLRCESLESIEIPNSVTIIGAEAFGYCTKLPSIVIPNSVTVIVDDAFLGCESLESIEIPNSVTGIGYSAFRGCSSLESIEIPESVTYIGSSAFEDCENLKTARVPVKFKQFARDFYFPKTCEIVWYASAEISGLKFEYDDATMTASVTGVENEEATFVEIPSVVLYEGKEYKVTSIGEMALESLKNLEIIEIPESVTIIGGNAFNGCTSLESIEIPSSVTSIGDRAFAGCVALTSIKIPSSVTSIKESAFMHCAGLTGIEVDKDNKVYDSRENCNAIIETTSNTLIAGCQNTVIPESVTSIGRYAFSGCDNLTKIEIPNSITSIGECAFMVCYNLTDIVIPESVTSIGEVAFYDCINLKTARVPVSLKGKVESAFPTSCKINWYDPSTGEIVIFAEEQLSFEYDETTMTASVKALENKEVASVAIPSKVLYEGKEYEVTSIGAEAFSACTELASVDIPESVTSIGENAFTSCMSLTSIEIPESVTEIGASAFSFCTSLTSIEIPSSITSIGGLTFFGCKNLKTARVPVGCEVADGAFPSTCEIEWYDPLTGEKIKSYESYEELGLYFEYDNVTKTLSVKLIKDKSTTKFQIPSHVLDNNGKVYDVTSIGGEAFRDCESLESIVIPNSITSIGDYAFGYCTNLTSIEIPNSVKTIGEGAFWYCTSLTNIVIPESVTKIGRSAFADCQNLKTARVPVGCVFGNFAFPSTCEIEWYDPLTGEKIVSMEETGLWFNIDRETTTASVRNNYDDPDKRYYFTEVKIPSKAVTYEGELFDITSIEEGAFKNSTSLTSIEIPESVTSIGAEAFSGCTNLKTARVPVSLKGKVESEFPSTCEIEWY